MKLIIYFELFSETEVDDVRETESLICLSLPLYIYKNQRRGGKRGGLTLSLTHTDTHTLQ